MYEFILQEVKIRCSERHHQVPEANQGAVRIGKQANNHMAVQDGHCCLVTILEIYSQAAVNNVD